jgi:hypothetical protein
MTVKQALKLKNRLINDIRQLNQRVHEYNSVVEGNVRPYSVKETLSTIYGKINELTALKTQIHLANAKVYDKIFLLSELKSLVKMTKGLDCTEGSSNDYYSRRNESVIVKTSEMSILERDNEVAFLESRIDEIQEELDYHNAVTELPVEQ